MSKIAPYALTPAVIKRRQKFAALGGADVRADDCLVMLPPSRSKAGEWTWLNDEPIAEAPAWLLDLIAPL